MTDTFGIFKISSAECRPYRLEFQMNVTHNLASRNFTNNILVEIQSDSGLSGFGECVPRKYVTGETTESVMKASGDIFPLLKEKSFSSPDEVVTFLQDLGMSTIGTSNPAALCAVELALLDLAGKNWGISVSDITGLKKSAREISS